MTPTAQDIQRAATVLAEGGVVAFPTETVYGLGASARDPAAVERIFAIKGRPPERALTVHIASEDAVSTFAAELSEPARALASALWPGPLTLVLRKQPDVLPIVTGGGDTVGVRVPDHPVACALIEALSRLGDRPAGVAAPSANRFGEPPPTTAEEVRHALGSAPDMLLDGGPCLLGTPSTVVDCTDPQPRILRVGAVSERRIDEILRA